ncbi:MAG: hypothetical protein Q7S79_00800 [bacterium]|nr:hypothetical protein [bacterium]
MNKSFLYFLGGAVFMFFALIAIGQHAVSTNYVLGTSISVDSIQTQVKDKVQDSEKQGFSLVVSVVPNIIRAITENPLLAPFMKTQREVGQAVTTVKNLPGDQRNAICTQICPN